MTFITCKECADFLMAYLDGELPADQRSAFETHLMLCAPCVKYLETYKQTVAMARQCHRSGAHKPEALPEPLVRAILASMKNPTPAPPGHDHGGGACGCDCGS